MPRAKILSGLLKDGAARLDAFSSSGKFHVLDIDLNNSKGSLALYTITSRLERNWLKKHTMSRDENWFYSIAAILLLLFVQAFVFNESWTHQRRVNIFYVQEAVVYTMNLLMLHATLRNTGSK